MHQLHAALQGQDRRTLHLGGLRLLGQPRGQQLVVALVAEHGREIEPYLAGPGVVLKGIETGGGAGGPAAVDRPRLAGEGDQENKEQGTRNQEF